MRPNQTVELLYGNTLLPKYDQPSNTWSLVPSNLHQSPKWGFAGYNNFFNSYTWWMYVYQNQLFIGTFDWSYLLFESLFDQFGSQIPPAVINTARSYEGADLLMLDSSYDTPVAVSLSGVGNFSNYGVRTMIDLNGALYLGTANPFNLLTDPNTTQYEGKLGGWELMKLIPHVKLNTTSAVTGPPSKFFSSGQKVTLKATVTSTSRAPTGTVKFSTSTTMGYNLGTVTLNSMGVATLTTVLPNGNNYIHVEYNGDANYNPSSSPTLLLWMYQ